MPNTIKDVEALGYTVGIAHGDVKTEQEEENHRNGQTDTSETHDFLSFPICQGPLRAWYATVKRAQWHRPSDVKAMFGTTVDFVGDNRVVFDISGNKYRLVAHVAFPYKRVLIKFVGTHGEYDRIDAETV